MECPPKLLAALDSVLKHGWGYTGQKIELAAGGGEVLQLNCTVNPVDSPEASLLVELWPIDQQLRATPGRAPGRAAAGQSRVDTQPGA
jgi:two-component system nitrogen regulation sensor histidine kinase GlnL